MKTIHSRFPFLKSRWAIPLSLIFILVIVLSVRLLSDPDMGSHLRNGKWIVENKTVPAYDSSTYTVTTHEYIDVHWMFQLFLYLFYKLLGYKGLSIIVTGMSLVLFLLLYLRNREADIPGGITCLVFLFGFLVIEQRLVMRPEVLTYLLMTFMLWILDRYFNKKENLLYFLPVIMIIWCNVQGLFVLGFILIGSYFISLLVRDRKFDRKFLLWTVISVVSCLLNPYLFRGILFPVELFTRFDTQNIYHQHIKELRSFYQLDHYVFKDILFILFAVFTVLLVLFTYKKRKIHEFILIALFLYLALVAVRNLALFAIVSIPIASVSLLDFSAFIRRKNSPVGNYAWIRHAVFWGTIIIPVILIPRIITNAYYIENDSYNKTGIGIDPGHQPVEATAFMTSHELDGRIINSIGAGGWLSWSLPQPVFMDARLEVMKEDIYNEVRESWDGHLSDLINRYNPEMFVYDYTKYYPWTVQLVRMNNWRVIYLDGFMVIFARNDYRQDIPAMDLSTAPLKTGIKPIRDTSVVLQILNQKPPTRFSNWMKGFWEQEDPVTQEMMNKASFCLQMNADEPAEQLLLENLKRTHGANHATYYALADIYRARGDVEKATVCYRKILKFDPENEIARHDLQTMSLQKSSSTAKTVSVDPGEEAKRYFNSGNQKYQDGDFQGAISDYNKAISLNPGYFKAYNNRGIVHAMGMKQFDLALKDFDSAISIKPDYGDAFLGRGTAKFRLNDRAGACEDWNKARSLGNPQANDMILQYCK